jgi:hypothetical protein
MAGMTEDWHLLIRTRDLPKAEILKGMLEENDIPVVMLNKQDSLYVFIGEIELYVPHSFREQAEAMLADFLKDNG